MRGYVIDADAVNRMSRGGAAQPLDDTEASDTPGITRVVLDNIAYYIGDAANPNSRLLVIAGGPDGPLNALPRSVRGEAFNRILRVALSQFWPDLVKVPIDWRVFHTGSLLSFQSNRLRSGISARVYVDLAAEGTDALYAFKLSKEKEPLGRDDFDASLFADAFFGFERALQLKPAKVQEGRSDLIVTYSLDETFPDANITQGLTFSAWRDVKLTATQRKVFDAPFDGPLRVKGPAGSGKSVVLAMRFLKELYARIDAGTPVRACFVAHGEETADHILRYLIQMDERGLLFGHAATRDVVIEIGTLHALANRYINRGSDNVQPLSLDGSEGRVLQSELIDSIVYDFVSAPEWNIVYKQGCRAEFVSGIESPRASSIYRAFCYDLSDEFANVLEALGVRGLDEIAELYKKVRPSERALARNAEEKEVVLELYRRFRQYLFDMNVVSLDQFTADFLAYLNSFRWDALRKDRGFDFVFADELHLFNAQERRVLRYLLRDPDPPRRVAVAYDPRQSPRNSFFPDAIEAKDNVWSEAKLESPSKPFELSDVFRYTPEILAFLDCVNQYFPASDLAEDWALSFGISKAEAGPVPRALEFANLSTMLDEAQDRAKELMKESKGQQVALLCLDPARFDEYRIAQRFEEGYAIVAGRDQLDTLGRLRRRVVLSMPEYVAGLQFQHVLLLDANAALMSELGTGLNGVHRFLSTLYLGGSRARHTLELFGNRTRGGIAEPIREIAQNGVIEYVRR